MPTYLCYIEKGLVCIIIIALFNCQPFSYAEYTKLNMYFSYNVCSVSNTKYAFLAHFYPF